MSASGTNPSQFFFSVSNSTQRRWDLLDDKISMSQLKRDCDGFCYILSALNDSGSREFIEGEGQEQGGDF